MVVAVGPREELCCCCCLQLLLLADAVAVAVAFVRPSDLCSLAAFYVLVLARIRPFPFLLPF